MKFGESSLLQHMGNLTGEGAAAHSSAWGHSGAACPQHRPLLSIHCLFCTTQVNQYQIQIPDCISQACLAINYLLAVIFEELTITFSGLTIMLGIGRDLKDHPVQSLN